MLLTQNIDIFDADVAIIAHQVNCIGVMGGGLALQVRRRFPSVYEDYRLKCESEGINNLLGTMQICKVSANNLYVCNLFGQPIPMGGVAVATDYVALQNCLIQLREFAEKHKRNCAVPYKIGCALGGGDWDIVYNMLYEIFRDSSIVCIICKRNEDQ